MDRLLPAERLLFAGGGAAVGTFRCGPHEPLFDGGLPSTAHCIVFSRTAVWIQHEGGARYVADPTVVTFHTRGRSYRRWRIAEAGDRCDWIAFPDDVVREAVAYASPAQLNADRVSFPFQYAASTPAMYVRQRRLVRRLTDDRVAGFEVEEEANALLRMAVAQARRRPDVRRSPPVDAVQHARELIARTPDRRLQLSSLAAAVGLSPYQLCRWFVRICGETMTAYRLRLRLLSSLEGVCDGEHLASIAVAYGFDSHSHFTAAFRRAFGVTPSRARSPAYLPGR
jgi:AraC family transcriptional regulator